MGTVVLCEGAPGLGKTLLAEIVAEKTSRILYRVQAGQLGLQADEVDKNLDAVFDRAERWGALTLIDEADVYIYRRGNDKEHNAIVAVFLVKLEYFGGNLFMTTNRVDDVDDAIVSRCSAVIRFKHPTLPAATANWRVMRDQFGAPMSNELIDDIVAYYARPDAQGEVRTSGRDILGMTKLLVRYARKRNVPIDLDLLIRLAPFRGLV